MARARIRKLHVSGAGKEPAAIDFGPGLTLITGLSNTGKSHVLECIDYALGAGAPPREIPEARGYDRIALEVETEDAIYTIARRFGNGENAVIFAGALDEWNGEAGDQVRVQISPKDPLGTLSGWLLNLSAFDPDTPVVKNQRGQSQALSFRTVAPFVLIKEPEVISTASPVLTPNPTQHTSARSVFRILLTGESPTEDVASLKQAHDLRAEATQRAALLDRMIEELRAEIAQTEPDRQHLEQELARIDSELAEVSEAVTESGRRLRDLMAARNEALTEADHARGDIANSRQLHARFSLLGKHYEADVRRLEFVLEGGHFFQQIAASHCPRCGRPLEPDAGCHPESDDFEQVERASRAEIEKLLPRMADLTKALSDADAEVEAAAARRERSGTKAMELDAEIKQRANPTAAAARDRVRTITTRRRQVEEHLLRFRELDRYVAARQEAVATAEKKIARYRPEQDLAALQALSSEIRSLLVHWKFPLKSDLHFSTETDDLVIDGKERAANGKGVRAVTHAAFTIGLMRHCITAGTPHPGFVVVDTPLTHFKGPTDDIADPKLTRDLHAAFLHSLASSESDGQAIIIENVDPPPGIEDRAAIHEFTGPDGAGRRGFYPVG